MASIGAALSSLAERILARVFAPVSRAVRARAIKWARAEARREWEGEVRAKLLVSVSACPMTPLAKMLCTLKIAYQLGGRQVVSQGVREVRAHVERNGLDAATRPFAVALFSDLCGSADEEVWQRGMDVVAKFDNDSRFAVLQSLMTGPVSAPLAVELINQSADMMKRGDLAPAQRSVLEGYVRAQGDSKWPEVLIAAGGAMLLFDQPPAKKREEVRGLVVRAAAIDQGRLPGWLAEAVLRRLMEGGMDRRQWDALEGELGPLPPVRDFVRRRPELRDTRGARLRLAVRVAYRDSAGVKTEVDGKTLDVRRGGIWAAFSSPIPLQTRVSVVLQGDQGTIAIEEAVVMRAYDYRLEEVPDEPRFAYGRAIRFVRLGNEAKRALDALMTRPGA